jgi:hypothetical protein
LTDKNIKVKVWEVKRLDERQKQWRERKGTLERRVKMDGRRDKRKAMTGLFWTI